MTEEVLVRDAFMIETADQLAALGHPLRLQILRLLVSGTFRTNAQLAELLDESRARLQFHVKARASNELIELVEERPKRGVTETYYGATARTYRLSPTLLTPCTQAS